MIGRDDELRRALEHLDAAAAGTGAGAGSAVLITGEAGMGKTTLVEQIAAAARAAGFGQLRCAGVQQEFGTGFSGLHELLRPALDHLPLLPPQQRASLMAIFGLDEPGAASPDRLLINTAGLALLEEVSAERPLLVVVEDVQWLDQSSASVVAFLVRRLTPLRTLLLATLRTGGSHTSDERTGEGPVQQWTRLGMTHLPLAPLTHQEASALLDELAPPPAAPARALLLREAAGNPLALKELATAVDGVAVEDLEVGADVREGGALPVHLPLPQRLERVFLRQVEDLPEATRTFLLLAAAGEDAPLPELLAAGAELGLFPADLDTAEAAGLVTVSGQQLRFRHPLVRSAVYSAAPFSARLRIHRALATALQDPVRAAWHRAAATHGPDEAVASELATAGDLAQARGALIEASAAHERAAALSPGPRQVLERTLRAAELARLAGRPAVAARLLERAAPLLADPVQQPALAVAAAVTHWQLSASQGRWPERIIELVDLAEQLGAAGSGRHVRERVTALAAAAIGVDIVQPAEALRRRVRDALLAVDLSVVHGADRPAVRPAVRQADRQADRQVGLILLEPLRHALRWRGHLAELVDEVSAPNRLASAAEAIHDLSTAADLWTVAVERAHYSREVSEECLALHGRALARVLAGDLPGALVDAELTQRIAAEAQLPIIEAAGAVTVSRAHTCRGDLAAAAAALHEAGAIIGPSSLGRLAAELHWAAGLLALAEHRHWEAWVHLRRTSAHPVIAAWAIADLTQAAVRVGKEAAIPPLLQQLTRDNLTYDSPHLAMLLERSRALLAEGRGGSEGEGEVAGAAFERALEHGAVSGAAIEVARTQLAYGQWLRRHHRVEDSREQLAAALRGFERASSRLGVARAGAELAAAGVGAARRAPGTAGAGVETLSPLELQIARLAAAGWSEEEIADRIYLSQRTVSSHLRRASAKLGTTSRAQLRRALGSPSTP